MSIADRYLSVKQRVDDAAARAGRSPADVVIVGVAKTFPIPVILEALEAGVVHIGENRPQELKEKAAAIGDRARWHLVGPLQTNKVRAIVGTAELIHSVDRFGLAEAIARRARALNFVQSVLVEVNLAGEASKHGAAPETTLALCEQVADLDGIEVRGLMAIPPQRADANETRADFRALADLSRRLVERIPSADQLSMGMSSDFEIAVEEGATLVRVGEAIFGARAR